MAPSEPPAAEYGKEVAGSSAPAKGIDAQPVGGNSCMVAVGSVDMVVDSGSGGKSLGESGIQLAWA